MDGNIIGGDEAGTEYDLRSGNISGVGREYFQPWTESIPALHGNIPGLDEAGTQPDLQNGNISGFGRKYCRPWTKPGRNRIGLGRKYFRPWTRPGRNCIGLGRKYFRPWTELIPSKAVGRRRDGAHIPPLVLALFETIRGPVLFRNRPVA